jgi:transcriptional regulator with AAA-type ATPase domain
MSGTSRDDQSFVAAGDDDALRLPDGRDLSASLRFHPHEGRILLGDERMVLLHVHALAELRRELIDTLGIERARATFIRLGYASGQRDAQYARKLRADASPFDLLAAGPQLHALEGMVHVTPLEVRFDIDRGHYHGEFAWRNSAEVDAHLRVHGVSESPVCWTLIGYASGYTSAFMGRPIVYRELSCRACGARRCRMLGKPLAAWNPPLEEFAFLASEPLRPTPTPTTPPPPPQTTGPLVGASSAFRAIWSQLQRVAITDTPVLLCGETGTGKDTLARALHTHGPRAAGPFIAVPCAALRPEQADELGRRLAAAADGTLYLDDIEALPPNLQAELAHALDRATDLRLVAASRHDLLHGTWSERLSPALLHRIGVFPVYVPPLRERRDDLPLLMRHLLEAQAARQRKRVPGFTERAAAALLEHDYPGNVRELKNLIERAVVLVADGAAIDVGHLFGGLDRPVALLGLGADGSLRSAADAPPTPPPIPDASLIDRLLETQTSLEALEEALIRGAVTRADGNLSAAARTLGLTRPQLAYRFRKSGRDPND